MDATPFWKALCIPIVDCASFWRTGMELFSRVFDTCLEFLIPDLIIPDFMSDPDVPYVLELSTSHFKAFGIH
jgi:hypothetical protein